MSNRRGRAGRPFALAGKRVWVAGHRGMVGSALVRRLEREGCEILTATRQECDLARQEQVERWMARARPHAVILAAAKVGGILANDTLPGRVPLRQPDDRGERHRRRAADGRREAPVPRLELHLSEARAAADARGGPAEGQLEPTNQWYAIAKIAGIKLCQAYRRQYGCDFISAMPTNLYGPGDNFDLMSSHVVPALIAKMHAAKVAGADEVEIWGTGTPAARVPARRRSRRRLRAPAQGL